MGAGPIVQRMQAATTQAEKMKVAFEFKDELMKDDPSGFKARMFFDQIGLGADKARLSFEQYETAQARIKPITPEDQERAQKFADSLVDLGEAWDHLVVKTGVELFPSLTKGIEGLNSLLDKIEAIDTAWDKWARGPSGKGTVLGKIIPGYDEQPNYNPRAGGVQRQRADEAAAGAQPDTGTFWSPRNANPRAGERARPLGELPAVRMLGGIVRILSGRTDPELMIPGFVGQR